jgi:HlyD family secretion protein
MKSNKSENTVSASRRTRGNRHSRRWLPWLGAVILVGLIVAGLWPRPAPVETARVTTGVLRATVNEEGKTRIKHRFMVFAPVAGQLRRIPFKAGADVKAGETVVATIDPLPASMLDPRSRALAEARRDTAAANLAKARTAHDFAASELKRFEKLFEDKTVSPQEIEGVQWREAATAKELEAAESALRQAEAELEVFSIHRSADTNVVCVATEVRAPASGRVLRVFEESARVVTAGMPLLEIGDPTDLEVVVEVLSRDGAAMRPGTRVELEQWGGSDPLEARVRLVEPAAFTKVSALGVEEQRVNLVADLLTPSERRRNLGDNFRVEARVIMWETNQALKIPSGAVFRRGSDWAAFVVEEGRARLRPVKVGRSSGAEMQVLDGLKEDDEVILYPGERIVDGMRVRPVKI